MTTELAVLSETDVQRSVSGKYLTFRVGPESFGIEVTKVREIMRLQPITRVPQMPPHLKGVLNLRGKIIPVMDLRLRLSVGDDQDTDQTCIVVVQVKLHGGNAISMGLIVDGVEEVINFAASDIEATPDFGAAVDTAYIRGMAKVKGKVKTLLDIDRLLVGEAALALSATAS
jgi:purine-binding chemotaxis protein CheW